MQPDKHRESIFNKLITTWTQTEIDVAYLTNVYQAKTAKFQKILQ